MLDVVHYRCWDVPFIHPVHRAVVAPELRRIFAFRRAHLDAKFGTVADDAVAARFGSPSWQLDAHVAPAAEQATVPPLVLQGAASLHLAR